MIKLWLVGTVMVAAVSNLTMAVLNLPIIARSCSPPSSGCSYQNTSGLMVNVWPLDLNIEFHKTIKQQRLPVQTAFNQLGRRSQFGSRFQQPEPDQRSENAGLHCTGTEIP